MLECYDKYKAQDFDNFFKPSGFKRASDNIRTCDGILNAINQSEEKNSNEFKSFLLSIYIREVWLSESNQMDKWDNTIEFENLSIETSMEDIKTFIQLNFKLTDGKSEGFKSNEDRDVIKMSHKVYHLIHTCHWLFNEERKEFNIDLICKINSLVMGKEEDSIFRTKSCWSAGGCTIYVEPKIIIRRLNKLCSFVQEKLKDPEQKIWINRFILACFFVVEFLTIHPFSNGNGRTARLLFSYFLQDFTPVPLSFHNKEKNSFELYIDGLKTSRQIREPEPFIQYALQGIRDNLGLIYECYFFS